MAFIFRIVRDSIVATRPARSAIASTLRGLRRSAVGACAGGRTHGRPIIGAGCLCVLAACSAADGRPRQPVTGTPAGAIGIPAGAAGSTGGVVATSEPLSAEAAAAVLAAGGNAIDAAAVAQFVLNVAEPQSSGIGGGGFMLVWLAASRTLFALDCRETAPAAATADMFLDPGTGAPLPAAAVSTSGLAVGVPGTLHCIDLALGRWGTIPLAAAMAPAIAAADGIAVRPHLAESLAEGLAPGGRLASEAGDGAYEAARAVFAPGGRALQAGERLRQPELAATFRAIAADGLPAFYDCAHPSGIARALVATQHAQRAAIAPAGRGRMTCADLAAYRPVLRQPVEGVYRGIVVRSMPAPSSGGLALVQMLAMLQRLPLGEAAAGFGFGTADTLDVMQDAMRLAFADRAMWVGDPDAVAGLPLRGLIDEDYLARRAATCPRGDSVAARYCLRAGDRLAGVRAGDPRPFDDALGDPVRTGRPAAAAPLPAGPEGEHTTHLTITDRWGNIVSYTTTIEAPWGSGLMVAGHGFLLNNELTDFNLQPRRRGLPGDADFDPGANDPAPGKRPRSSMAPTMLFVRGPDGDRPVAAYGSPGGSTIINTLLNMTLNLIDHRLPVQDAVDRPRISLSSPADDATTLVEDGFDPSVLDRLVVLGYRFRPRVIGSVQAVVLDPHTGRAWGAADGRRDGAVIGLAP